MENVMEWIMPLVFLVIWGLTKMFGGNKEGEQGEPASSSSPPVEVDRTQEIQEEIRRRIAERKQAQRQQPKPAAQTPSQTRQMHPQQPTRQYEQPTLRRPATQPYAPEDHPFQQQSQPTAQTHLELIQEMEEMEAETARKNLEKQLADQRIALQEARAHAARVKGTKTWGGSRRARRARQLHDLRAEVLSSLQNASGSRKAFLLMEILGAPVSVRQEGGFLHFWEQ